MKFRPSLIVEEFIEGIHTRVGARNKAVLGRAGLFLALGIGVPPAFEPTDSKGKDLDDETDVPDELRDTVRAALSYRSGRMLDESGYRLEFRRYFEFGCTRLKQLWDSSANDQTRFVSELLKLTAEDFAPSGVQRGPARTMPVVETPVKLKLLLDADEWTINEAGHNGLLVISGKPGTGKSQLALDLLGQIARQSVRFVFFDLKGELEDDPSNKQQRENRKKFLDLTGARTVRLIHQDLPINPLIHQANPTVNAKEAYEVASMIRAFAPQPGAKQERAIADAYQHLDEPDFVSLADELEQMGANGVELALMKKIVALNLFASAQTGISPEEWLKSSLVID